jgi:anti-sigma28 factor (negative regulator of flagellin synthesis)
MVISRVNTDSLVSIKDTQGKKQNKKPIERIEGTKKLDRIETIKQQIQNGEYKLDLQKSVQMIVDELI